MAIVENKRTDAIRVRLSPDLFNRVEKLATRYGMPPATYCAFLISHAVVQQEDNKTMLESAINKTVLDRMESLFSEDSLERVMTSSFQVLLQSGAIAADQAAMSPKHTPGAIE